MVRIKICGLTTVTDAQAAARAGADAIGLVFVPRSQRFVAIETACEVVRSLPPFINRVGLFMDQAPKDIERVLAAVALDTLQFHGDEAPADCAAFGLPWIKALAMGDGHPPNWDCWQDAQALLLDSHAGGTLGGSGQRFDWRRIPALQRPWILAGGLDAQNVAEACRQLRPHAVDVSSGVEKSPGIKDHSLMKEFIGAARNA